MKRISSIFIAFVLVFSVVAQETETEEQVKAKTQKEKLPSSGDYGLGFNAIPVLDFALNAVNIMDFSAANTAQHPGFVNGQTIFGKYFLDNKTAIRARVSVNMTTIKNSNFQQHPYDTTSAGDPELYEDVTLNKNTNVILGGGLEKRIGTGNFQGIYGGEAFIGLNGSSTINKYGIEWNAEYDTAQGGNRLIDGATRDLKNKNGLGLTIGLRGFVGVEYFVAPKISLGAEFGLLLGMDVMDAQGKREYEEWDDGEMEVTTKEEDEYTNNPDKSKEYGFGVDNGLNGNNMFGGGSGSVMLTFYF